MNVENIRLINFRNYKSLNIELNEKMNIFIGKNAQGKTNLLESIYMCATGKSFRTNRDKEIINLSKGEAYIGANIKTGRTQKFIEIKMERDKPKRIRVNKIELKSFKELYSGLNVVVFSPDDLRLIKEGPFERRNFLDMSISQIKPVYKHNINRYNKILFQRNNLLKSNKSKSNIINLLEIFDLQLVKVGTDIIISRNDFIEELSKKSYEIHSALTLGEELKLNYISNVNFKGKNKNDIENYFLEKLKANANKDLITGTTEVGPHRDDMEIKINDITARNFASQGQQRTIVLSIKLSEVEMIKAEKGVYPVLLLDDVFSELDKQRRKYLVQSFNEMQTIITATDIMDLTELEKENKTVFYIEDGKVLQ